MEFHTASLCTSCLCCLTINVYEYSCTWLVCSLLITSATIFVCECRRYTASVCTSLYLTVKISLQVVYAVCVLTWLEHSNYQILHERLALFIQLFISEIILRITNCLLFKCKYNITRVFYNLYLYRTITLNSFIVLYLWFMQIQIC
jgi:hypothetical protein